MNDKDPYDREQYRRDIAFLARDAAWTRWKVAIPAMVLLLLGMAIVGYVNRSISAANEAADIARQEFGAQALLNKYEWFKNASAQLDARAANIKLYQSRIKNLDKNYSDKPREKWPRDDREQYALYMQEVDGIKASYNALAAEYNAAMAKANWAFANRGTLPKGAETRLPREYKPYVTE